MRRILIYILVLSALIGVYNWRPLTSSIETFLGNQQYARADFSGALASYDRALEYESGNKNKSGLFYNRGNTLYRLGESASGSTRTALWTGSLASYKRSLDILDGKETRANYEFVQKKLTDEQKKREEEKQKQEEQKQKEEEEKKNEEKKREEEQKQQKQKEEAEQKSPPEKSGSGSAEKPSEKSTNNPQPGKTWTNNGSYNTVGSPSKDADNVPLTAEQTRDLENYSQSLEEFQKHNGKYLNPESDKPVNPSDQINQFFQNNSMLRDVASGDGGKDW